MDDDDFDARLNEAERRIQGIDDYVRKIRSGEGLPTSLLRSHELVASFPPSAPAAARTRPDDIPRGRAHAPRLRADIGPMAGEARATAAKAAKAPDVPQQPKSRSPSPVQQRPPRKHVLPAEFAPASSSSSSSLSSSTSSSHHHAAPRTEGRGPAKPEKKKPEAARHAVPSPPPPLREEPQLEPEEAKEAFERGVRTAEEERRKYPRPCMCPVGECEAARLVEEQLRKANARLAKQAERETQERVQRETLKLRHEMDGKYRMGMHEMDEEYTKKLERLKQELQEECDVRHEERNKAAEREEALVHQIAEMKAEAQQWQLQMETDGRNFGVLGNKLAHFECLVDDLEKELHAAQTTTVSLKATNESLEQQLRFEKTSVARLQCDLDHAQTQLLQLGTEVRRIEGELETAVKAKASLEQERFTLNASLAEVKAKLAQTTSSLHETEAQLDKLQREHTTAKNRLAETEAALKLKEDANAEATQQLEELRRREHYLKQEVACYVQRIAEKDEETRELFRIKRELDAARSYIKDMEAELTAARNETKLSQAQRDRDTVELRKLNNDVLALTQENVKLRKEVAAFQKTQAGLHPLAFGTKAPQVGDVPILPSPSKLPPDAARQVWEAQQVPPAGAVEKLPEEWTYKPPDGISIAGGGGGTKAPVITVPDQPPPPPEEKLRSPPHQVSQFVGSGCILPKAATAAGTLYLEGLEKQLMLLQMEKSQIESELSRLPVHTRGYTVKQRTARLKHEERLGEVDTGIHKIRQELRLAGRGRPL